MCRQFWRLDAAGTLLSYFSQHWYHSSLSYFYPDAFERSLRESIASRDIETIFVWYLMMRRVIVGSGNCSYTPAYFCLPLINLNNIISVISQWKIILRLYHLLGRGKSGRDSSHRWRPVALSTGKVSFDPLWRISLVECGICCVRCGWQTVEVHRFIRLSRRLIDKRPLRCSGILCYQLFGRTVQPLVLIELGRYFVSSRPRKVSDLALRYLNE